MNTSNFDCDESDFKRKVSLGVKLPEVTNPNGCYVPELTNPTSTVTVGS